MAGGNIRQLQSPPPCVYCGLNSHHSSDCNKVSDIASRWEYLARNKLCYNCARSGHLASKCKGWGCGKCNGRHHTSICDKMKTTLPPIHKGTPESLGWSDRIYGAMDSQNMYTLHATVIAKVGGVQLSSNHVGLWHWKLLHQLKFAYRTEPEAISNWKEGHRTNVWGSEQTCCRLAKLSGKMATTTWDVGNRRNSKRECEA